MIAIDAATLAGWVGGDLDGDATVVADGPVQTDSREPLRGGVFIAKRGEESDGHLFVAAAARAGARIAIVEHPVDAEIVQIIVNDSVTALADFARAHLARARAIGALSRVIAITGSVGKTTTKHLLGAVLGRVAETVWPERSFNNEVGLPLTVLRITEETRYAVLEMGASSIGDIRTLTGIAHPDVGCVLCVGMAHAGEFGGVENIRIAKREMVEALDPDGHAILNRDDRAVAAMAGSTSAAVTWFGSGPDADVRYQDVETIPAGIRFTLSAAGASGEVTLRLIGEHNAANAAAAAACALTAGVDFDTVLAGLAAVEAGERWRMQVLPREDGVTVINDGYNANPTSMSAAIKTLAQLRRPGGRVVAVLGGMAELGEISREEHDKIGRLAVRLGIDQLVAVGEPALPIHIAASQEGSWGGESVHVEDLDAAFDFLSGYLRSGDVVLTKSSMVYGLRFLGDRLAGVGEAR